jgi:hypothetical protein
MHLVRWYAKHPVLPRFVKAMTLHDTPVPSVRRFVSARPAQPTVDRGATVHGTALWWSGIDYQRRWDRHIWKVEFYVDGKLLYTDHTWPYSFHRTIGWDSRSVPNGRHMLSVRAFGTGGYRAWKRIPIRVANPPLHIRVAGAVSGGAVSGQLQLTATVSAPVTRVVLYADGVPVSRDASAPFSLHWNTIGQSEGAHELVVYARDARGHRAALQLPVVVANNPGFPSALSRNWVTHHLDDNPSFLN